MAWSHTFLTLSLILKLKSPGLNLFVLVLSMIERRLTNGTVAIHLLKLMSFIFLPVIMLTLFSNLLNTLSSIENVKIFPILTLLVISSYFPPLLQPNGSTDVSSFSKAELFAQTFATNSTLDDAGDISPTPPHSNYFIPKIKILYYDVFHALSGLNSRKAHGPDGVPPVVLKSCASALPAWSNSFICVSLLLPILLAGNLLIFNVSLKWVTAPILQTTAL